MERDHTYHIWPRDLDFASAFRAIEQFALERGLKWANITYPDFTISFNSYEVAFPYSMDEFLRVLEQPSRFDSFHCKLRFCGSNDAEAITFVVDYNMMRLQFAINSVNDDTVVAAHDFIRREWRLSNPPIHACQEGRPRNLQATIFLGKHFDSASEQPARTLRRFLELLRFDVQEAEEYRALPIPEKIQRLIERQDIYVGIVIGRREHSWLTSEASYDQGKNRHVIMLVEDGSDFNPVIQGRDYEHIPFPVGVVEKASIKLLEEFRSLGISVL
jgi:hypothetical protein